MTSHRNDTRLHQKSDILFEQGSEHNDPLTAFRYVRGCCSKMLLFVFLFQVLLFQVPFAFAADISPYLDSRTIGVVRIDLKQMDVAKYSDYVKSNIDRALTETCPEGGPTENVKQGIKEGITEAFVPPPLEDIHRELVEKAKAEELFLLFDKDAIATKKFLVLLAVAVPQGASQEQIDTIQTLYQDNDISVTFVKHGFVVGIPTLTKRGFATQQEVEDYAQTRFETASTEKRPEFDTAFSLHPDAACQLVVGRIAEFQQELEQFLDKAVTPFLMFTPKEDREEYRQIRKTIPILFQGLNYYSFACDFRKPELRGIVHCTDEETAKRLWELEKARIDKHVETSLENFTDGEMPPEMLKAFQDFFNVFQTKQNKNEIVTVIDSIGIEKIETVVYEAIIKPTVQLCYE